MAAPSYDFDLAVIGGGSGGLSCAQEAANLGKRVALFDFVEPTVQGTKWGLGGTCVNVGCIPKKLMHMAAQHGDALNDAKDYGWDVPEKPKHSWETMMENVNNHIRSLNFGYRSKLMQKHVSYINARVSFVDSHRVSTVNAKKETKEYTAEKFLVAVGGRPRYLDIPGGVEHVITSDDFFWLKNPPGKTLVIGASYIALENAGILTSLGFQTAVMSRSVYLRAFDQQMANMIVNYMKDHGTRFIPNSVPSSIEKLGERRYLVKWRDTAAQEDHEEEFETVMTAVGRKPETEYLQLEKAGVKTTPEGKIPIVDEVTNVDNIYALGDVAEDRPELTPVAILAGRLLARRLYGGKTVKMDYDLVPTTVFTPIEYGSCGLSEEAAIKKYGEEDIEVYHTHYTPLEWTVPHREENACYAKLICLKSDKERIIGVHIVGPNSGEITQGFAVAMKAGLNKETLDGSLGIHPTIAEELTKMDITKRSGQNPQKSGC